MTEVLITKKNVVLDATILTSLMTCPRFADLRYNHRFVQIGGKSNSLEAGSIVHKILEVYNKNLINGFPRQTSIEAGMTAGMMYIQSCPTCKDFEPSHCNLHKEYPANEKIDCEDCKVLSKPSCGHEPNEYPGTPNTPDEAPPKSYKTGWKHILLTMEEYFDYYRNDHWVTLEAEVVKGKILYEDEEIRILWKAKLDWVVDTNQGIYPVDHKTMKQRRDNLSLNNQFIGQCLIMGTRNMFLNKIGFQASLKPEEKFIRPAVSYSAARLMEWQSEILPYYAKLLLMYDEAGYYPPNFTACEGKFGNCVFCGVCGSDPGMREEELKNNFVIGPEWNPQNDIPNDGE